MLKLYNKFTGKKLTQDQLHSGAISYDDQTAFWRVTRSTDYNKPLKVKIITEILTLCEIFLFCCPRGIAQAVRHSRSLWPLRMLWRWSSENREKIIRQTAEADGKYVIVCVEQEPGSGGKNQIAAIKKFFREGDATHRPLPQIKITGHPIEGDKVMRANIWFPSASHRHISLLVVELPSYAASISTLPNSCISKF